MVEKKHQQHGRFPRLFDASIGMAALDVGVPGADGVFWHPAYGVVNTKEGLMGTLALHEPGAHPFFDFDPQNFTFMGFDFSQYAEQLKAVFAGQPMPPGGHVTPLYERDVAGALGLPDLPYGETAHVLHFVLSIVDTAGMAGALWQDPALMKNPMKVLTHPEFLETVISRTVMLATMGVLHPMGMLVAIGVAHLASHLVHSGFEMLHERRSFFQRMEEVPVLGALYRRTGIQAWAESDGILHRHSRKENKRMQRNEAQETMFHPGRLEGYLSALEGQGIPTMTAVDTSDALARAMAGAMADQLAPSL